MAGAPTELTDSALATERAGEALAAGLVPGDVVLVSGELGSGKTTFVRGAARALGVTEPVTSPTFVVGHLYEATAISSSAPPRSSSPAPATRVAHLDLYRLAGLDGEDPGLLDPYFGADVVTFVEWPERVSEAALLGERPVARRVVLAHAGGDRRSLEILGA